MAFAQPPAFKSMIIGDGVHIRSEPNLKGNVISKVYKYRVVEFVEESKKKDDLEKKDSCELYDWVKIKWSDDSIGWVFGKYFFTVSDEVEPGDSVNYHGFPLRVLIYQRLYQPWWNGGEGPSQCDESPIYAVVFQSASDKYSLISDKVFTKLDYLDFCDYNTGSGSETKLIKTIIDG